MAAALLALNQVFGDCYDVSAEEVETRRRFEEKWPKDQFIFDVQTHHVDVSRKWYETPRRQGSRPLLQHAAARRQDRRASDWNCSTAPTTSRRCSATATRSWPSSAACRRRDWDKNPLPPDQMVATRKYVNDLAGSQRVLSHGLLRPNLGKNELEEMERQVKELKIDAWKMYTGAELGEKAWFMDDEKVAYPFWEKTQKLGIRNLCVHKGLPLGAFNEKACTPLDLEKAAKDFPDLNFIIYHSGYPRLRAGWASGTGEQGRWTRRPTIRRKFPGSATSCASCKSNPKIKNIYFELGSTFHMLSAPRPKVVSAHARPDDPGRPAPTTSCGAPIPSGTAARRARSSGCAG